MATQEEKDRIKKQIIAPDPEFIAFLKSLSTGAPSEKKNNPLQQQNNTSF